MFYADGKTEPKKGDTVLGDALKGRVVLVGKETVRVRTRLPFDPEAHPSAPEHDERDMDPAGLSLVIRG